MNKLVKKEKPFNLGLFKIKVIVIAAIIVAFGIIAGTLAINHFESQSKTTKIGFEDIGELNTQVAYVTVVDVITDPKKLFGVNIPFTESKYIYSYDVVVKAGLDFDEIKWKLHGNKITVTLPEPEVISCYIDEDSGKVYHEKESIFSPITLAEEMEARQKLVEKGKEDAIENGLLDHAKENAEVLLTSLFKQHNEYEKCEIAFKWKK